MPTQDVVQSQHLLRGKEVSLGHIDGIEEVTATFLALSTSPDDINEKDIVVLERFSILLYYHTNGLVNIDEARKQFFSRKGRAMDAIPPTTAPLRELYAKEGIAGDVPPNLPSPEQWRWTDPDNWKLLWKTLPEASSSSRELYTELWM